MQELQDAVETSAYGSGHVGVVRTNETLHTAVGFIKVRGWTAGSAMASGVRFRAAPCAIFTPTPKAKPSPKATARLFKMEDSPSCII